MDTQDRKTIDGLFDRLDGVDRQNAHRDAEAEALIRERVARSPNAPYLMAQTIVMQDYALSDAQRRIEDLESRAAAQPAGSGGFLSGLFGGGAQQPVRPAPSAPMGAPMGTPSSAIGAAAGQPGQPPRGGGFLAGAAQTAMGVAGGVLLGSAIGSMFGGGAATAAETPAADAAQPAEPAAAEPAADDGGGMFGSFFGGDDETL